MSFSLNFGTMSASKRPARPATDPAFRIALLGDFSARANRGELETGDALARRKAIEVDVDNLDDVIERMGIALRLPIGADGGLVAIDIGCMDDFHPDDFYDEVEVFEELAGLRRRLMNSSTFDAAAAEVLSWPDADVRAPEPAKPRGNAIPKDGKLSDFASLVGRPTALDGAATEADELIKQLVGPFVVPGSDPRQEELVALVDRALSESMRAILHHPDFQTVESLWRSVDFLVRRLETSASLKLVLYDITAEEVAADLSCTDTLEDTGLYRLLVEQPLLDANQGALSALIGNYTFEQTPPHAELLGRLAGIAASAGAPFVTALGPDCMKQPLDDLHPLVRQAWRALCDLPAAAYLGIAVPRFLLRMPYGKRTEPIDPFDFEEFSNRTGLRGMLWGNPAVIVGLLLGQTNLQQGVRTMKLGSIMQVGEMPFHYYTDGDGDQIALPCTERMLSARAAEQVTAQRLMPMLSIKGRPEVRLGSFQAIGGGGPLAGPWNPVAVGDQAPGAVAAPAAPAVPAVTEVIEVTAVAPEPESEPAPTPAASVEVEVTDDAGSDDDLDALLAELSADDDEPATTVTADEGDDEGMDPELAALLAEL